MDEIECLLAPKPFSVCCFCRNGSMKSDYKGGRSEEDLVNFFKTAGVKKDEL